MTFESDIPNPILGLVTHLNEPPRARNIIMSNRPFVMLQTTRPANYTENARFVLHFMKFSVYESNDALLCDWTNLTVEARQNEFNLARAKYSYSVKKKQEIVLVEIQLGTLSQCHATVLQISVNIMCALYIWVKIQYNSGTLFLDCFLTNLHKNPLYIYI